MNNTNRSKVLGIVLLCLSLGSLAQAADTGSALPGGEDASSQIPKNSPNQGDLENVNASDTSVGSEDDAAASDEHSGDDLLGSSDVSLSEMDTISVDFPNEEIRTILRNVADLYMLNLVVPETLQGTASIKLRDVNWRQIFSVVLDPVGYTFIEESNIIKIISLDVLSFEPPVTNIFMLDYSDANAIAGTIRNMVDSEKGGRVQVDARTNGVIVTAQQSQMNGIKTVIDRLDKPTQQVLIETRFIEVSNSDVSKIGVNWSNLGGYGLTYSGNKQIGGVLGTDSNPVFSSVANQLTNTDIVDTSKEIFDGIIREDTVENISTAIFSGEQFGVVISALDALGDSRLVSNPTVVTLNNQEAMISIGEQYPIPTYAYNEERGSFEVSDFEFKDIGVILRVKPSVNNSGLITLTVEPEVSSQSGSVPFGGASGTAIPIIATRRTKTQISLKDGYTMGIGGLMESTELNDNNQVPLLGKIPLFGNLFKHKSKENSSTNLLIFITARILAGENADFEDVFSKERIDGVGLDLDELRNQ